MMIHGTHTATSYPSMSGDVSSAPRTTRMLNPRAALPGRIDSITARMTRAIAIRTIDNTAPIHPLEEECAPSDTECDQQALNGTLKLGVFLRDVVENAHDKSEKIWVLNHRLTVTLLQLLVNTTDESVGIDRHGS